jgi:hypothetical protein
MVQVGNALETAIAKGFLHKLLRGRLHHIVAEPLPEAIRPIVPGHPECPEQDQLNEIPLREGAQESLAVSLKE